LAVSAPGGLALKLRKTVACFMWKCQKCNKVVDLSLKNDDIWIVDFDKSFVVFSEKACQEYYCESCWPLIEIEYRLLDYQNKLFVWKKIKDTDIRKSYNNKTKQWENNVWVFYPPHDNQFETEKVKGLSHSAKILLVGLDLVIVGLSLFIVWKIIKIPRKKKRK
jgi:hypothetical protein